MNTRRLSEALLTFGAAVLCGAAVWWAHFYGQILDKVPYTDLGDAIHCLYTSNGACGLGSNMAQIVNTISYNPLIFWVGPGMLGLGAMLRLTLQ